VCVDVQSNLMQSHDTMTERVERLKQRRRQLKERAATLRNESQSANESLDALRLLLQELDPETLVKLQREFV
jgi:uncharacterized coiled-coil DUF342 family protein